MAEATLSPFLNSVLALRPPLATSTRTNLAPSFQLLQSIVNSVYGANGIRGLEPGLWRAQLIRTTNRAAQLIEAVWTKLGGKGGVILDDQGEDGRGVMRLQGLFSDIQMFVGSLTTLQDPLTAILLDPIAFSRTQATVTTLTKKLASLATHYEVADSLPTPLDQWPDEDVEDKAEDLSALPLLIAKSRPTRAVLKKFEADCAQREQAELPNPDQPDRTADPNDASSKPSAAPPPAASSFASSGLSSAKRPEFLRFVYSQNPNLITNHESLDTAVAAGTAALSSMVPSKPSVQSIGKGPAGPKSRKSLVQQRISSFASSGDAPPPLPVAVPISLPVRRVASDNQQNPSARKSWTVDMSGLNGIQRQSSLSISKPPSLSGPSPQISVAAPPVNWKPSISRPASIKSRSSLSGEPSDLSPKPNGMVQKNSSVTDEALPADSDSASLAAPKPTFAEQAAAIVAARKQRTISQSSSSTLNKDRLLTKSTTDAVSSTGLPVTPENPPPLELQKSTDATTSTALNPVSEPPSSLNSHVSVNSTDSSLSISTDQSASAGTTTVTNISPPSSDLLSPRALSESTTPSSKIAAVSVPPTIFPSSSPAPVVTRMNSSSSSILPSSSPARVVARLNSISSTSSPKPQASPLSPLSGNSLSSSPPAASVRRPSLAPPEPDLDFELVSDLIEHTSMLDVILGPTTDDSEPVTVPSSVMVESDETGSISAGQSIESHTTESMNSNPQTLSTSANAPATEELSLADLMKQASMFESWTPDQDQTSTQSVQIVSSPDRSSAPAEYAAPDPLSASFISPPLSPIPSLACRHPSASETEEKSSSAKATSQLPQRPSHLALQPVDKLFGSLPEAARSEAALTIAGSPVSTPSISGQSWATSLMSTPPAPSDFDWNLLNGNYYKTLLSSCLPPPENPLKSGWRILCLDGGGIRGLSMLYVVRELMTSIQTRLRLHKAPLPCEIFEMICGIGTGGIIALLLGRLRLDISVAIEAYLQIVRQVFRQSKGVIAAVRKKTRFSATKLEAVIREVVKRISGQEELYLADQDTRPLCRTFMLAMRPTEGKEERGLFSKLRSYGEQPAHGGGCSIAQAGRATSAAPLFFKAARVDELELEAEPVPQSELSLNNPSMEAVKEAQTLCPGRRIECLISLGAGKGLHNGSGSIARACAEMGESSERVAREVEARAAQEGWSASYFRASVKGLKNEDNRGEWENPDWVKAGTVKYLFIDARSQFDRHLDNLINSWKSSYEEEVLRRILLDHGKGSITPRSAFLPSRSNNLAPRADDLRRSISADHAEMQAQASSPLEGTFRKFRSSNNSAAPAVPPLSPASNSRIPPFISHYPASLYEGVGRNKLPQPTPPLSSDPHLSSFDLKLPEFNFSKT
ncbi:hypothetical protein PGTUg99_032047 [Puccinia graminis f. sp. tritici]|uniref:PNPLA domain-containing protein n=1 Tax=Puccinia graminis f. sp. tritici TaxID=56615 RepID=A0A5B0SG00_PUCGR|nr:hypothetical protein PGTUg99_032047 [Puccinia graminis f. sp. tritici]